MSLDEDIQLRDLVAQTLESNGTLARIKAHLRASIFLALDEDDKISSMKPSMNNKVTNYLETEEGIAMFCLVHEFLEFLELNFTLSVYQSETYCDRKYHYEGREKLIEKLGLENIENTSSAPLLFHLVKMNRTKPGSIKINLKIREDYEEKYASENTESDDVGKTVDSISTEIEDDKIMDIKNTANERKFNTTFDLTSPTVNSLKTAGNSDKYITKKDQQFPNESQNFFDGTFDKMSHNSDNDKSSIVGKNFSPVCLGNGNRISEAMINGFEEESPLKDMSSDKNKISPPMSDKVKTKNSLSSLSDLPPIQLCKPRVNVILPSLYSKESKDKSNSLEHEELFDMSAEYEEDFMGSGDDLSSDCSKTNLLDELLAANESMNLKKNTGLMKKDSDQKVPSTNIPDCNKSIKPIGDSRARKDREKNCIELINVNSETDLSDNLV